MKLFKVLGLSLLSTLAIADTPINETLDADEDGEVIISNVSGSVEVEGWSRNQVEVTGTLGDRVEELIFERDGDEILIKVKLPRKSSRNAASDLVIKVPEASSLNIDTVSADIEVEGVQGELDLNAVSGDITTTFYGSELDAEAVSGDVEVAGDNQVANVSLQTVSGDIETEDLAGEFRGESVSGDVTAVGGPFERVRAETVNGDILLHAQLSDGGRMDVETINGEVDIDFKGDVSAEIDIETFNGSIRNCFGPESVRTSKYAPGRELDFTEGSGSGRVRINTLNGNVRLCK
ncbi:MAG: DUF4097 family beta strand repeat-containing protein [Woeseiaceae bacterium]